MNATVKLRRMGNNWKSVFNTEERRQGGVKGLLNHIKILAKAGITDCRKKSG